MSKLLPSPPPEEKKVEPAPEAVPSEEPESASAPVEEVKAVVEATPVAAEKAVEVVAEPVVASEPAKIEEVVAAVEPTPAPAAEPEKVESAPVVESRAESPVQAPTPAETATPASPAVATPAAVETKEPTFPEFDFPSFPPGSPQAKRMELFQCVLCTARGLAKDQATMDSLAQCCEEFTRANLA